MNKIVHDTKGLSAMVTSLSSDVTKTVKLELSRLATDLKDKVHPALEALKRDLHNSESGFEPRLKRLESEHNFPPPLCPPPSNNHWLVLLLMLQ